MSYEVRKNCKRTSLFLRSLSTSRIVESCSLEYRLQEVPNVLKSSVLLTTRTPSHVYSVYRTDDADNTTAAILFLGDASRSSLTPFTSISSHALKAIAEVHRHGRHSPAPRPALAGFLGVMTITVAALHHLTRNIKIIPQASGSFSQQQSWSSSNRASSSNVGAMRRSTGFGGSVDVSDG